MTKTLGWWPTLYKNIRLEDHFTSLCGCWSTHECFWKCFLNSGSALSFLEVLSHFWKCSLNFGSALSFLEVLSHFWKCSLISGSALSFLHYNFNGVDVARKTEDIAERICLLSVFYWYCTFWIWLLSVFYLTCVLLNMCGYLFTNF